MSDADEFVRIECVTRRFGAVTAVDAVDLSIREGEFFALLGGSGSGKSTLLRVLAGFERPDRGRVLLGGEDITDVPPHRRPLNLMFQSYALFPHLSVAENVAFGLRQEGVRRDDRVRRVGEALALVELDGLERRRPSQLSGGQRQRVALARALVKRPRVLLLDEPLSALDARLREQTQFELKRIHEETGITFIVVTHDQDEALTLADRIGVMRAGRIEQAGPAREVYEKPANRFVADFLGNANLLEGEVVSTDGDCALVRLTRLAADCRVPCDGIELHRGQAVALAVRPEVIDLHAAPPEGCAGDSAAVNLIRGEMAQVLFRGAELRIGVWLGDDTLLRCVYSVGDPGVERIPAGGQPVCVCWDVERGRLLTA